MSFPSLRARIKSYLMWQWSRARQAPAKAANYLFGTLWYDRVVARGKRVSPGEVAESNRCLVYLMFPKNGVQASHMRALTHFRDRGYAPVVVSNLPLSPADRDRLLKCVHVLIERPNYGYDFGGYRDGVLHLEGSLGRLERLVLMNDSVWFPLSGGQDWLAQVEQAGSDVVGAVANCCVDAVPADMGSSVSWRYNSRNPRFHYCSFALSFGPAVLQDPSFLDFWRRLKLSNDKFTTIDRGEVGLGQWIVRSGHSHRATFDVAQLDQDLDRLDEGRLRLVAQRLIIPEDAALRARKADILAAADDANTRQRLKNFILVATAETGAAYALLDFALKEKAYAFVKKSPLWLDEQGAAITLLVLEELGEYEVLREASLLKT